MHDKVNEAAIINTESRTLKWFLGLFYVIFFSYEIFYNFVYQEFLYSDLAESMDLVNFPFYILVLSLIPLAYFIVNEGKILYVKYIFISLYFILSLGNDLIYLINNPVYRIGNIADIALLLFSPIFVNTRFFWFVFGGLMIKYCAVGFAFSTTEALFPTIMVVILALISYVILKRFHIYVEALGNSYNNQLKDMVKGVIATIELKDRYTSGHSERVAFYAQSLAEALNKFSKSELKSFYYACLLHDIGKVSIPDEILMKPGRLTTEEYEIIKTHPAVGTEAIRKVDGLNMSNDVIMYHHERWDGTGYPAQLRGKQIPLLARVVSIADAFDAMTSSRSYRNALTVDEAYQRIIEGSGSQFDPNLVEVFKTIFPEWVHFHQSYEWPDENPLQDKPDKKEVSK